LTKIATLLALACLLITGVAVVSVLARDSVPAARSQTIAAAGPTANREGKKDKLPVVLAALPLTEPAPAQATLGESLRQAFAADSPVDIAPAIPGAAAPMALPQPAKPKLAAKPPAQKSYALLSDAQIAAIKGRLNLSSSQEYYWPSVEEALRAVARKLHALRQANPNGASPAIDPDSAEVQQLKSAAMPLLFQLREDQKQEVRSLARIIGLHAVAAQI
jgi:ABC-type transporter Mla MlaB component